MSILDQSHLQPAEKRAYIEEFLAAFYFIAAGIAFEAEYTVLGWLMVVKAIIDTVSAAIWWRRQRQVRQTQKILQ